MNSRLFSVRQPTCALQRLGVKRHPLHTARGLSLRGEGRGGFYHGGASKTGGGGLDRRGGQDSQPRDGDRACATLTQRGQLIYLLISFVVGFDEHNKDRARRVLT